MTMKRADRRGRRAGLAALVACAAAGLVGGSIYEFPRLAKTDRPASPADCRDAALAASPVCAGVALPAAGTEIDVVGPGLTIAAQIGR